MPNTGKIVYGTLTEIYTDTGLPTGNTKPNIPSDPDFVPPIIDYSECPTTTTTTIAPEVVHLEINNLGNQVLDFNHFKAWYQTYPGGFIQGNQTFLTGSLQTTPDLLASDDFIFIDYDAAAFSDALSITVNVYYQIDAGSKILERTFTINPFSTGIQQWISVPRSGTASHDVIFVEFSDIVITTTTTSTTTSTTTTTTTSTSTTTTSSTTTTTTAAPTTTSTSTTTTSSSTTTTTTAAPTEEAFQIKLSNSNDITLSAKSKCDTVVGLINYYDDTSTGTSIPPGFGIVKYTGTLQDNQTTVLLTNTAGRDMFITIKYSHDNGATPTTLDTFTLLDGTTQTHTYSTPPLGSGTPANLLEIVLN